MSDLDRTVAVLRPQLMPGEDVRVVLIGVRNQYMIGTDRRVFVWKKGFMAGAMFGKKLASWDYQNISGIHFNIGMLYGVIVIQAPGIESGVIEYQSSNKRRDAFSLPHAIPVVRGNLDANQRGVSTLRGLIAEAQASRNSRGQVMPSASGGEQGVQILRELAGLRDTGVITPIEFERKKADILSRM